MARNVRAPDATLPPRLDPGEYVELAITDAGPGIQPEHLARVFDPYFTTKPSGSGLGLAASYSIVRNHRGAIDVASEPGRGTTFRVYLPASTVSHPIPAAPSLMPTPTPLLTPTRARVLVMDDEHGARVVARRLLAKLGYDVELACNGTEALERYQGAMASLRPFDVVIFDLTVHGGMGGAEAIRRLLVIDPAARAIVSSGYSEDAANAEYKQLGFRTALPKPYNLTQLREVIDGLLVPATDLDPPAPYDPHKR